MTTAGFGGVAAAFEGGDPGEALIQGGAPGDAVM
jgi:hypothetical protein